MEQKNKNKISQMIKKYPGLVGIALVILVMGLVLYIKLYERWATPEPMLTESMARSSTVDGFTAGSDVVRYLLSAVQEDDLDKAMRAFPIDEMTLGVNAAQIIDMEAEFSSSTCPPSANYMQYVPVASSEISGRFAEEIVSLQTELDWKDTEILDVRVLRPENQSTEEYQQRGMELSSYWGADWISEMAAEIKCRDKLYLLPVTVIKYNDKWKVFQLGAAISDDFEDGLIETDKDSYNDLTGPEEEGTQYIENPEQQFLPSNYFLAGQVYSNSPEKAIIEFSKYLLEKGDITSALCYGDLDHKQLESDPAEVVIRQKEFAEQIAEMYYGILLKEETKNAKGLEELGMSGSEIIERLNPQNIPYVNLKKIVTLGEDRYEAVYSYESEQYIADFTMMRNDSGWQIKSLTLTPEK